MTAKTRIKKSFTMNVPNVDVKTTKLLNKIKNTGDDVQILPKLNAEQNNILDTVLLEVLKRNKSKLPEDRLTKLLSIVYLDSLKQFASDNNVIKSTENNHKNITDSKTNECNEFMLPLKNNDDKVPKQTITNLLNNTFLSNENHKTDLILINEQEKQFSDKLLMSHSSYRPNQTTNCLSESNDFTRGRGLVNLRQGNDLEQAKFCKACRMALERQCLPGTRPLSQCKHNDAEKGIEHKSNLSLPSFPTKTKQKPSHYLGNHNSTYIISDKKPILNHENVSLTMPSQSKLFTPTKIQTTQVSQSVQFNATEQWKNSSTQVCEDDMRRFENSHQQISKRYSVTHSNSKNQKHDTCLKSKSKDISLSTKINNIVNNDNCKSPALYFEEPLIMDSNSATWKKQPVFDIVRTEDCLLPPIQEFNSLTPSSGRKQTNVSYHLEADNSSWQAARSRSLSRLSVTSSQQNPNLRQTLATEKKGRLGNSGQWNRNHNRQQYQIRKQSTQSQVGRATESEIVRQQNLRRKLPQKQPQSTVNSQRSKSLDVERRQKTLLKQISQLRHDVIRRQQNVEKFTW